MNIQNSKQIKTTLDPAKMEDCETQSNAYSTVLGCIKEEFGVGSYLMYLSAPLFVFLALLLFEQKRHLFITPLFIFGWLILSELAIKLFKIPVTHTVPFEGDVRVLDSLYFQFGSDSGLIILFILITGSVAGVLAYVTEPRIRKLFTK